MPGKLIIPNDRVLISKILLESGIMLYRKDHTMNEIYSRMLEV